MAGGGGCWAGGVGATPHGLASRSSASGELGSRRRPLSDFAHGKGAFGPRIERALVWPMSAEVGAASSSSCPCGRPDFRLQASSPGPRGPLNSPWRSQGASGRGGPRRAGSERRGEAHSCMVRSENRSWGPPGPGEPGGHGRARPASSGVWMYGLSSTRRSPWSDGSVWPGAVNRPPFALPRVCGGPSHVNNVRTPDFSTTRATSGPLGRAGRRAYRGVEGGVARGGAVAKCTRA